MEEAGRGPEIVSITLAQEIHLQGAQAMGAAGSVSPKCEVSVSGQAQECQIPTIPFLLWQT